MDSIKANDIHKKLQLAMKQFAAENGLSVSPIKGSYTPDGTIKLAFVLADVEEVGHTDISPDFIRNLARNGKMYGLSLEHLNKEFDYGGLIGVKFHGLRGKKAVIRTRSGETKLADALLCAQLLRAKHG